MIENNALHMALHTALTNYFGHSEPLEVDLVQSLWSGYGAISMYKDPLNEVSTSSLSCIGKVVNLQKQDEHPRGWNSDFSHQRKLSSYLNEQRFYTNFALRTNHKCQVPKMYAAGADEKCIWMLLEDLDAAGFTERSTQPSLLLVELGIKWLANFHACFIDSAYVRQAKGHSDKTKNNVNNLWPIGTYWHLATRPQEFQKMPESPLKEAASKIDACLNNSKFKTIVHGDAKLANFCINSQQTKLAAVDFQYVGRGVGIKDFVYFLGSCLDSQALYAQAPNLLTLYFNELKQATAQSSIDFDALEEDYLSLYPFAWADFERFLTGWSPGHQKLNAYSSEQTQKALKVLAM